MTKANFQVSASHLLRFAVLAALTLTITCLRVSAQQKPTDGATPLGLAPGAPAGSYALSDFESVNLYNGHLNFHLPLVNIGGRGGAGYSMILQIDRKWIVQKQQGTPNLYEPQPSWWDLDQGEPILSVGKLVGRYGGSRDFYIPGSPCTGYIHQKTLTRLTFTAPDGTEYELRDQSTNGEPHHPTSSNCSPNDGWGRNRGKVFVTADGTSATFVSDEDIKDYIYDNPGDLMPTGYMVLRDGTRYDIVGGKVMTMRDRNGNKVTFNYNGYFLTSVTDSLNRQITIAPPSGSPAYIQIALKGFGGATRYIKVYWGAATLRSDFTARTYKNLFNNTLNNASDQIYYPYASTAVELPNGQQYQFQYNDYGELARIVVPTGGAIEYDYAPGLTDDSSGGVVSFTGEKHVYRRVIERRLYPDGGTGSSYANKTTYSRPESSSSNSGVVTERLYAGSTLINRSDHYFYGSPRASLNQQPTDYGSWKDGREYQTQVFDANETTLLRQVDRTFQQRAAVSWWTANADLAPPNDPRLVETVTTLGDTSQVSKQTSINPNNSSDVGFDQYNNQTDVWEYDFGPGSPGSLLRHAHTTFVTSSTYTNVEGAPGLVSLPSRVSLYNASGVERSRTTFEYDVYSGTNHHTLVPRSSISGLCSGSSANCPNGPDFTDTAYVTRGNVTATSNHFINPSGTVTGSITAYAQYDVAGNVVKTVDGRGYETTVTFNDCFGAPDGNATTNSGATELGSLYSYALPTSVTNALSQTSYAQFDFYTSRPVDGQDANGIISSGYSQSDALDRPTKIIKAVNGGSLVTSQTVFDYDDANHKITTTTDFESFGDSSLKRVTTYDKLGRTTEKKQYEDSTNYIAVQIEYDALGRAYKTSNPYRPLSESAAWTTTLFDTLGRAKTVTTPDSSVITSDYSGNRVLVADQDGKKRISLTDGLGRLKEVWEVTGSDSATESVTFPTDTSIQYGYVSRYGYDTLDNLTTVSQRVGTGGVLQERTFEYDSLKRLTSATNPESGTISYQYDENGNLLVKTDARTVSAHYQYDALNRIMRRWYNGSSGTSYTTNNSPSLPSGVAASAEVSYLYDNQSLLEGAPGSSAPDSYSRGFSVGRLVAVNYGGGSAGDYYGYDAGGRMTIKIQRTGSINYKTTAVYNVGGALKIETYPSKHTVTNAFDSAGRLQSMAGNIGDGFFRTYATGITYASLGGLQQEQYGTATAVYNKLGYNNRGQLTDIRVSTSGSDTSFNRGKIINDYGTTNNNGNLKQQTVYVPNSDTNDNPTSWYQQYSYDSMNRLTQAKEYNSGSSLLWQQTFGYDRFGNRAIDYSNTTSGIPRPQFDLETATNRLYGSGDLALAESSRSIRYDAVGNLYKDLSNGGDAVNRAYDAENRMTQETQSGSYVAGTYTYDANGRRVKRTVGGIETWQVYGVGGELIAEYAATGATEHPQKEYGYRNGQLLITAESGVALGVAPESLKENATSTTGSSIALEWAGNGASNYRIERKERNAPFVYLNHNSSPNWSDSVSPGSAYLYRVCAADSSNNCTSSYSNVTLGVAVTFTDDPLYGLSEVSSPASATDIKASHINELRTAVNAVRYLALLDNASYAHPNPTPQVSLIYVDDVRQLRTKLNEALTVLHLDVAPFTDPTLVGLSETSNPANATPVKAIHIREFRERLTGNVGSSCYKSIDQFVKDFYQGVLQRQPTAIELSSASASLATAQSQSGSNFITAGQSFGTSLFTSSEYAGLATSDSQFITDLYNGFLQRSPDTSGHQYWLDELQGVHDPNHNPRPRADLITAFKTSGEFTEDVKALCRAEGGGSITGNVHWMVDDQLGTPRMILDASGSLVKETRHDYLPFGEELTAGFGNRTSALGFTGADGVRQQFTQKERDNETGLDYFGARYFGSMQGRFASPDPLLSSATIYDPQTWNRYSYVLNNPMRFIDPLGLYEWDTSLGGTATDADLNKTKEGRAIVQRRNEFRDALRQAASAMIKGKLTNHQRNEINRSLSAYGGEGVANGVTVANGVVKDGADANTSSGNKDGYTVDPATGAVTPSIMVTLNKDKSIGAEAAAHEGSHVADREALVGALTAQMSTEDWVKSALNVTTYATESRAYEVSAAVAQGQNEATYNANGNEYWNRGWSEAERATKMREGINKVLQNKPYKVTPGAQGPRLIELKK
jgi:RHS repeat-associated protein